VTDNIDKISDKIYSIGLSNAFNNAVREEVATNNSERHKRYHEKNINLDAMDGDGMYVARADSYAFAANARSKRDRFDQRKKKEFRTLITLINSFQSQIEANFNAIDDVMENLNGLIDNILTGISDTQAEVDIMNYDHAHVIDWIESREGNESLEGIQANMSAQRLYKRYCERTGQKLDDSVDYFMIIQSQMTYEENILITRHQERLRELGELYNETIGTADRINSESQSLQSIYHEIQSLDNTQYKADELERIQEQTERLRIEAELIHSELENKIYNDHDEYPVDPKIDEEQKVESSLRLNDIGLSSLGINAPSR